MTALLPADGPDGRDTIADLRACSPTVRALLSLADRECTFDVVDGVWSEPDAGACVRAARELWPAQMPEDVIAYLLLAFELEPCGCDGGRVENFASRMVAHHRCDGTGFRRVA